jgi:flagellar biosynthesis/type III secretory pathway chaperone
MSLPVATLEQRLRRHGHDAGRLLAVLQQEYQALLAGDAETLFRITAEKRALAQALESAGEALRTLDEEEPQLAAEHPLAQQRAALQKLAEQLRRQNLSNAAALHERQSRLRWIAARPVAMAAGDRPSS